MTSYEDAYRQMHAHWHGYPPVAPSKSSPSPPHSSPPLYHPQPSNAVPYDQDLNPFPVEDTQDIRSHVESFLPPAHGDRHVRRAQVGLYRPTPALGTAPWVPYEPMKHKSDLFYHDEDNKHGEQNPIQTVPGRGQGQGKGQADRYRLTRRSEPPEYENHSLPYLPGAAQYLQRRESQNGAGQESDEVPAQIASGSMVQARNDEYSRPTRPNAERSITAQPSKRLSTAPESLNSQTSKIGRAPSKRSAQASSPSHGTQYAPLEISSSPEPDRKRGRTANNSQIVRPNPREAPGPTRPIGYNDLPKQELTKMVAESTNVQPGKVRYYAVAIGREPGVYFDWPTAERQVHGFFGAKHKKFKAKEEALAYVEKHGEHIHNAPSMQVSCPAVQRSFDSVYHSNSTSYEPIQLPSHETKPVNVSQDFVPLDNKPKPVLDDEPKLVPEQQHVVDLIVQGHNVFYTGSAGCGKSTILKAFVKQLQQQGKRVKIVAPTNLAALNVGGQTTWNFAGWTPDSMKIRIDKLMENSRGKENWKKFDETDVLVIDEISMIENLQFERLNMILKASRGEKYGGGAFGGMQLVVTGDFYQLAPVKPFSRCMCGWELEKDHQHNPKEYKCTNRDCREHTFYDIDKWAFRSQAWEDCGFKHVNLTQIHRQSDMMFKSILNRIRTDGTILKPHASVLLNHTSETEGAIEIYARRIDVDRVNNQNINKIPSAARAYKCLDHFHWPDHHRNDRTLERNTYRLPDGSLSALKEHRFETQVQLKLNQRVVLQANLEPAAGLVNGAQGTIIEFKEFDEKALPKAPEKKGADGDLRGDHAVYRQEQIKAFADANGHQPWPVVRFTNGVTKTIFADCTVNVLGNEEPWCRLSRTQIPLAAGYAITVHKSQGMTLDRVTADLARAFEPSQIYVALSRARSLKGLTVTALPRFDLGGANAQVKEFMENVVMKKKAEPQVAH